MSGSAIVFPFTDACRRVFNASMAAAEAEPRVTEPVLNLTDVVLNERRGRNLEGALVGLKVVPFDDDTGGMIYGYGMSVSYEGPFKGITHKARRFKNVPESPEAIEEFINSLALVPA